MKNDLKKNIPDNGISLNSNGKGATVEVDNDFVTNMMSNDDPNCAFKRGDKVLKATYAVGDIHPIDTPGVIVGTIFEKTLGEAYLVQFKGDEEMCFTIKAKLKLEV